MASVKTVTSDQGFKNVLLNPNNPLQPGDIVYIYPGTYHQSLTLESGVNVAQSGFSQEFITITAFDPMNPPRIQPRVDIIEQPKLEDRPKVVELIDVNYVVLDGLILDGSSGQTDTNGVPQKLANGALKLSFSSKRNIGSSHNIIRRCALVWSAGQGILTAGESDDNQFLNLLIRDHGDVDHFECDPAHPNQCTITPSLIHGIYLTSSNNVVDHCEIFNSSGFGVIVYSSVSTTHVMNNIIRNCIVHHNGTGQQPASASHPRVPPSSGILVISDVSAGNVANNVVYNNIVRNNPYGGIWIGPAAGTQVYNNTVYHNNNTLDPTRTLEGIYIQNASTNTQNNISYMNVAGNYFGQIDLTKNWRDSDPPPPFVDITNPEAPDLHLTAHTPHRGDPLAPPVTSDADGGCRPSGTNATYDMGAYEFEPPPGCATWLQHPGCPQLAGPQVLVVGPTLKVRPTDQSGGASSAQLLAARNEFESFQIVIQAGSSTLQGVNVTLSAPLTGAGTIPANNITIYREDYYNVTVASDQEGAPGLWPDVLIPTVDHLLDPPQQRRAFPIDVPAGENRVAWVDVLVPQAAATGMYSGSITVTAMSFNVTVPVQLTVFNATLPSTSSLKSIFETHSQAVCQAKYNGNSCPTNEEGWRLNTLLARAALNNRITITSSYYQYITHEEPLQFFRNYTLPLLNGTAPTQGMAPTQLPGARLTSFRVDNDISGSLGVWKNEAQLQGFTDRAFVYACDEPGSNVDAWAACKSNADQVHQVWPEVPILVTASIQNANKFNATGYVNWLVCIVEQMDDKPTGDPTYAGSQRSKYDAFLGLNPINRVWLYTSCESYGCEQSNTCESTPANPTRKSDYFTGWPSYAIDQPASEARAMGWLSFLYDTIGELYFSVVHCLSLAWTAQYSYGGNGTGTLFYPGSPDHIGGTEWIPLESMRLKLIRDGYEDYEYLKILADRGQDIAARQIAQGLFANMYTTNRSDAEVQAARRKLAHLIDPTNIP